MELKELLASPVALPSIPKVVAQLLSELDQDEPDLRKISQWVKTDPALTTRLLQMANSAMFQLAKPVGSVSEALAVLGLGQVRSLVCAAAVGGAFTKISGMDMPQFWRYSLNVAKLARTLAGMLKRNTSTAFTAGLIHAVGELVMHIGMPAKMLALDKVTPPLHMDRAQGELSLLGYCYAEVGAGFARAWHFPPQIVEGLGSQVKPFENEVYEPLSGVLHLAAWRARAKEADYDQGSLADTFPDVVALHLKLDIDMVLQQDPIDWTTKQEAGIFVP
jgi:HD-like signal output (HDOD) protein